MTAAVDARAATTAAPEIILVEQQIHALELILTWLARDINEHDLSSFEFKLGGYAGTGKTTLIKYLLQLLRETKLSVAVAAFTGKAVSVLIRKGVRDASTLHSLLYDAVYNPETKRIEYLPKAELGVHLIIVDEASMVSNELYDELRKHGCKLLFVGDPAQLEPVGKNPNLMAKPDYTLTEIHRQAALSPIIRLATYVREGKPIDALPNGRFGSIEHGIVELRPSAKGLDLAKFDVIVCGKNITRHAINKRRRNELNFHGDPQVGESIICLDNNKEHGVYNGLVTKLAKLRDKYKLDGDGPEVILADLQDDLGQTYPQCQVFTGAFGAEFDRQSIPHSFWREAFRADFGYCLTAHKSQGSEWDNVLVIAERLFQTDFRRWLYTGITRAAKLLTVVRNASGFAA